MPLLSSAISIPVVSVVSDSNLRLDVARGSPSMNHSRSNVSSTHYKNIDVMMLIF